MNKFILIIFLFFYIIFLWCSQKLWIKDTVNIDYHNLSGDDSKFLEDIIMSNVSCNRWYENEKTFISFSVLDKFINEDLNMVYDLMISWEWMYIDKRWNISSSCWFWWIPTEIIIKQTNTWFILISYKEALDWSEYFPSLENMFSSLALEKWKKNDYTYNTQFSPLKRAEKYFWINFWTGGDFVCEFCDRNRYESGYTLDSKDGKSEWYQIFWNIINSQNRYIIFRSDWSFQNYNSRDEGTGIWIFWKDDKTILVDAYPYHTYDRYIIKYLSGDVIHLTREILQK